MNVFLSIAEFESEHISRIREQLSDHNLYLRHDYSDHVSPEPDFLHSEVVFGNVPAHWFEQAHAVRWAQLDSVGFGEYRALDWSTLSQTLSMTNLAGFFADPVAQSALAGILALYRGMDQLTELRSRRLWQGDPIRTRLRSLSERHVVLFGYGAINRRLEELLKPFQCRIHSYGSSNTLNEFDDALPDTDIVVCTVPETDSTVGLFDARRFSLLKPDALFVNCGRGSLVDENALAEALHNQRLGGAVIDVTAEEPLPSGHAFWSTPNTILSQHSGGGTEDELDRKIGVFVENLARYKNGSPLENIVDFQRGY